MHRFIWLSSIALIVLAACGGSGNPRTAGRTAPAVATTSPSAGQTTISWAFWGDPQEVSIDRRIVTLFEQEHPEIHVEMRWAAYNDYVPSLEQWWQQDDAPDVAFLFDIPAFAARGKLLSLAPFVSRDRYDLRDFYPNLLDQFTYENALYGLPRDNDTKVIFYNKDMFDAYGLAYPPPSWTWADLRRDALALSGTNAAGQQQYGFAFEPRGWWKLWTWQNGGDIFDDPLHPTRSVLNSDANAGALRFLRDLIYTDHVTPPRDDLASSERIGSLFTAGRLAMAFGNHALVPLFGAAQGLRWGVAGLPTGIKDANYAGGAGYVISAGARHQQAAWTFLQWLLSAKGEAIFTESGLIVPSRRSVGHSNLFMHQGSPMTAPGAGSDVGSVFLAETEKGVGQPAFPGSTPITDAIDDGLEPIWSANADPATILTGLAPKIDAMLKAR